MRKALAVGRKEFRQIRRDLRTLLLLLLLPGVLLVLYGYALNFDIRNVRLAVQDRDRSTESRALISAFLNSGYFDLAAEAGSGKDIDRLFDANEARAALVVPEGLGEAVKSGRPATVQVLIDGDNANLATTVLGYATAIVRGVSLSLQVEAAGIAAAGPPVSVVPRVWFNPELRSALFLVPGLIAFISMLTGAVSTAVSIVREKEQGTMEQVRMAPIDTFSFVVGKTIPYFLIAVVSALSVVLVAMALFGLPMRGSWAELMFAISLFTAGALGTGLLVSTIADSQLVAFQVVALLAFLPTFLLSGFVFPISSMPVAIQVITHIVPARYFLVALRTIVLKGVGIHAYWQQLAALSIYLVVVIGLSALRLARERA
ncbi:MAG: ABC transporter permease [Vicinamibacterales bacterium]